METAKASITFSRVLCCRGMIIIFQPFIPCSLTIRNTLFWDSPCGTEMRNIPGQNMANRSCLHTSGERCIAATRITFWASSTRRTMIKKKAKMRIWSPIREQETVKKMVKCNRHTLTPLPLLLLLLLLLLATREGQGRNSISMSFSLSNFRNRLSNSSEARRAPHHLQHHHQ